MVILSRFQPTKGQKRLSSFLSTKTRKHWEYSHVLPDIPQGISQKSIKTWISKMQSGHLPVSFNWTSYIYQLWTSIQYRIGALPADMEEAHGFLEDNERDLLPLLGVNRNIRKGWRTLHRSFLGTGLFNFQIELMIQRINLFLQHYDSPFDTGVTLRARLELLQLQVGFSDCALFHPFLPYGKYATHCRVRSFWQTMDFFNLHLFLEYPSIPLPREQDHVLLQLYEASNWDNKCQYYVSWNRCRIANKALLPSDIATPDGKQIDSHYLDGSTVDNPPLSEYNFGLERPCEEDSQIWREFWESQTYPGFILATYLGPWSHGSHQVHEWYYNIDSDLLFHIGELVVVSYTVDSLPLNGNRADQISSTDLVQLLASLI